MKSVIHSSEIIVKEHFHDTGDIYYPAYFIDSAGRKRKLLFTNLSVIQAEDRATGIDFNIKKKWWEF